MSSMAFEYSSLSVRDASLAASPDFATATTSTSGPASRNGANHVSNASNMPSFKPVFRPYKKPASPAPPALPPQAGPGPSSTRNGFSAYRHAGIGATVIGGGREQPSIGQSDSNLLRPVTFVKSSSKIAPTIDDTEQEAFSGFRSL